jgi:hypothetical protein
VRLDASARSCANTGGTCRVALTSPWKIAVRASEWTTRSGGTDCGVGSPAPLPRRPSGSRRTLIGGRVSTNLRLSLIGEAPLLLEPEASGSPFRLPADAAPPKTTAAHADPSLSARRLPEEAPPVRGLVSSNGGPQAGRLCERGHCSRHGLRSCLMRCHPALAVLDARWRAGPMRGCMNAPARLATPLSGTDANAIPPQLRATLPALP